MAVGGKLTPTAEEDPAKAGEAKALNRAIGEARREEGLTPIPVLKTRETEGSEENEGSERPNAASDRSDRYTQALSKSLKACTLPSGYLPPTDT